MRIISLFDRCSICNGFLNDNPIGNNSSYGIETKEKSYVVRYEIKNGKKVKIKICDLCLLEEAQKSSKLLIEEELIAQN